MDGFLSASTGDEGHFQIDGSYLIHNEEVLRTTSGNFRFYFGIKAVLRFGHEARTLVGVPLGLVHYSGRNSSGIYRMGVYMEIAPAIRLAADEEAKMSEEPKNASVAVGIRLFI